MSLRRLYAEERLQVRRRGGRKRALAKGTTVPAAGPEPALIAGFSARSTEQSLVEMRMQNLGIYHFDDGTCPL